MSSVWWLQVTIVSIVSLYSIVECSGNSDVTFKNSILFNSQFFEIFLVLKVFLLLPQSGSFTPSTKDVSSIFSPKHHPNKGRREGRRRQNLKLQLLQEIKSLDHLKCFPKVLCGLSVDASNAYTDIDPFFVRSYIQLMRSANPVDDSREESQAEGGVGKEAMSLFSMMSGLYVPEKRRGVIDPSSFSSSSEQTELSRESSKPSRYKSPLELRNEALEKIILSKRTLDVGEEDEDIDRYKIPYSKRYGYQPGYQERGDYGGPQRRPILSPPQSLASHLGAFVSEFLPWLSLSFGSDSSFEQDPFFKKRNNFGGGIRVATSQLLKRTGQPHPPSYISPSPHFAHQWPKITSTKDYEGLADDEQEISDWDSSNVSKKADADELLRKLKKKWSGRDGARRDARDLASTMVALPTFRSRKDWTKLEKEMLTYSMAVDIGKKLKDSRQCDYLYNGCPVAFDKIVRLISSVRKDLKNSDETVEELSSEIMKFAWKPSSKTSNGSVASSGNIEKYLSKYGGNFEKDAPTLSATTTTTTTTPTTATPPTDKKKKRKKGNVPMTQISHVLPTGEKVQINVQLSNINGKDSDGSFYSESHESGNSPATGFSQEEEYSSYYEDNNNEEGETGHAESPIEKQEDEDESKFSSYDYDGDDEITYDKSGEFGKLSSPAEIFKEIKLKKEQQEQLLSSMSTLNGPYRVKKKPLPTTPSIANVRPTILDRPVTLSSSSNNQSEESDSGGSKIGSNSNGNLNLAGEDEEDVTTSSYDVQQAVSTSQSVHIGHKEITGLDNTVKRKRPMSGLNTSNTQDNVEKMPNEKSSSTMKRKRPMAQQTEEKLVVPHKNKYRPAGSNGQVKRRRPSLPKYGQQQKSQNSPSPKSKYQVKRKRPSLQTNTYSQGAFPPLFSTVRPEIPKYQITRKPSITQSSYEDSSSEENSKIEGSHGNRRKRPSSNQNFEATEISENKRYSTRNPSTTTTTPKTNEKKRIRYKNPKRPYLVLTSSPLDGASSSTSLPRRPPNSKGSSSDTKISSLGLSTDKWAMGSSTPNTKLEVPLAPVVVEPGSEEYPHWVPNIF